MDRSKQFRNIFQAAVFITIFGGLNGYPGYQTLIPNGEVVPHPCNPNWVWNGVGHLARGGGGDRNQFGIDFASQGKTWTKALCEMDSDGDGKTNGEELGDPQCLWEQGKAPNRTTNLSHPGICDPLGSTICVGKTAPNCEEAEFKCDALNEVGIKTVDIRIPPTPVPARETVYTCMYVDLPQDNDYHIVASTPIIDNINVMHHILLYACADADAVTDEVNVAGECFMGSRACQEIIAGWTVGANGECLHPDVGFRVGNNNKGYKKAMIELHWNNPAFVEDYTDSSGLTLHLTTNLRPYDAGVLMIGQMLLEIPPQAKEHVTTGTCSSSCTSEIMSDSVNVIRVFNHMHYLGRSALSEIIVPGTSIRRELGNDQIYNYDRPIVYDYMEPMRIDPGNELSLTCNFASTSRTKTTFYGEGTNDEMCFAFITYYPKENIRGGGCVSYLDADVCEYTKPVIRDCNTTMIFDGQHIDNQARYMSLVENCQIGKCLRECIDVVNEINQHPCYSGTMRKFVLEQTRGVPDESRRDIDRFWSLLQSCDATILEESYRDRITNIDPTGSSATPVYSLFLLSVTMLLFVVF